MRLLPIYQAIAFGSIGTVVAEKKQEVHRNEEPLLAFDHTVLGNLQSDNELEAMEGLQLPAKHLFTASIRVGSPPQELTCLLDSGSADLWIPSKRCKVCEGGHHFKADQSNSFMPAVVRTSEGLMPVPVQVSYGRGDIVGFLVQDHVTLSKHLFNNQSFIIVEDEQLPEHRSWDGVCGLGWRQLTDAGRPMYENPGDGRNSDGKPTFTLLPQATADGWTTLLAVGDIPQGRLNMPSLAWATAIPLAEGEKNSYWVVQGAVRATGPPGGGGLTAMGPRGDAALEFSGKLLVDTANAYIMLPRKFYKALLETMMPDPTLHRFCGTDPSQGNLVVCDCAATKDNAELREAHFAVVLHEKTFAIRVPDLFKRVPAKEGEADLCLLLVQQAPDVRIFDPLEVLADLLKATDQGNGAPPSEVLAPFLFPGLLPAALPGKGGQQPEQIEEIQEVRNGRLCTTTLVWVASKLKQNTTSCKDAVQRRLQGLGVTSADPIGEVIVLGGVFLEHFAVVFDFGQKRLGIAKPPQTYWNRVALPAKHPDTTYFSETDANGGTVTIATDAFTAATVKTEPHHSMFSGFSMFLVAVLAVLAALVGHFWYQSKRRRNLGGRHHEDSDDGIGGGVAAVAE